MAFGAYKLITKQNSDQIKNLGDHVDRIVEKFDDIRMDLKTDQAKTHSNFEHIDKTVTRIEKDTTITREKTNDLSQAVAKIEVRLHRLENGGFKNDFC
jgi:hypothetical protein